VFAKAESGIVAKLLLYSPTDVT